MAILLAVVLLQALAFLAVGLAGPLVICAGLLLWYGASARDPLAAHRRAVIEQLEREGKIRSLDVRYRRGEAR